MYSRQSNKPSYLRGNHSPEGTTWTCPDSQWRGKVTQLALGAAAGDKYTSLTAAPARASAVVQLIRQIPHWQWEQQERLWMDAASRVLSVPPGCNCHSCWWLSRAPRSVDPSLSPSHPFCDLIWTCALGKKEPERLFPIVALTHRVCSSMEAKGHSRFTGNGRCRISVELWQESCFCQSVLQPANGREQP